MTLGTNTLLKIQIIIMPFCVRTKAHYDFHYNKYLNLRIYIHDNKCGVVPNIGNTIILIETILLLFS